MSPSDFAIWFLIEEDEDKCYKDAASRNDTCALQKKG